MEKSCVCGKLVGPGRSTCGDSYCQEADYHRCMAKNARKGRSRAAWEIANEKIDVAVAMRARREGGVR